MIRNRLAKDVARVRTLFLRSGIVVVLVCAFAVVASAYTLVFKNGNRMEIPDEFTITRTTLTYEISPGFQKTIMLSLVDIAATERANNEGWGSFFRRNPALAKRSSASQSSPSSGPDQPSTPAVKTVTNSDLAAIRQRRLESEKAYEQRRLQLGLPTVAETRLRQQEEERVFREELRNRAAENSREESFWRGRARELRTEIASVDNQINYVRARLNEVNESARTNPSYSYTYPTWPDYGPWSRNGRWGRRGRWPQTTPPIFGPQNPYGYPNGYPNGYPPYGYPPNQYPYGYPNQYPNQNPYGYPNQYPYGYPNQYPNQYPYGYPGQNPYGYPTADMDKAAQHADLTRRLDDLLTRRAGLMAQWQALEDEARDARVPQVWLEP